MLYAFLFFILKFMNCQSYTALYISHVELFDSGVLSSSYGICGLVSMIINMGISIMSEAPNKDIPLILIMILNLVAAMASTFLKRKK